MSAQRVLPVDGPSNGSDSAVQSFAIGAGEVGRSEQDVLAPLRKEQQPYIAHPAQDDAFLGAKPARNGSAWLHTKSTIIPKTSSMHALLSSLGKPMLREKPIVIADRPQNASKSHTLLERFNYKLDTYISSKKGQVVALAIFGLCVIMVGGCSLKSAEPSTVWRDSIWDSWTYLADPGSHTSLAEPVRSLKYPMVCFISLSVYACFNRGSVLSA